MELYRLMTDLAEVHFEAATHQVAAAVTILCGRGRFGVRRVYDDESVGDFSPQKTDGQNILAMKKVFPPEVKELQVWIDANVDDVIEALDDMAKRSPKSEIVDYATKVAAQMRRELEDGTISEHEHEANRQ